MPIQQMMLGAGAAAGGGGAGEYIDDIFSTYVYVGNGGGDRVINNNIDLTGGGLVWTKSRSSETNNILTDSARGISYRLVTNSSAAQASEPNDITSFDSDGYKTGSGGSTNSSGTEYVSWTYKETAGFFDIVTYTGNGSNRTVAHNLGSVPGLIFVKKTNGSDDWYIWHTDMTSSAYYLKFEHSVGEQSDSTAWNSTDPTSTHFSLGTSNNTNDNGDSYVAYLFANNDQSFGVDGDASVIKCGVYTGNGSADGTEIDVGWEPQLVLHTKLVGAGNWHMMDNMRGIRVDGDDAFISPNRVEAEDDVELLKLTSTGFKNTSNRGSWNSNGDKYIWMAIRRPDGYVGKPITTGTNALGIDPGNSSGTEAFTSGFPVDYVFYRTIDSAFEWYTTARPLEGQYGRLVNTNSFADSGYTVFDLMTGFHNYSGYGSNTVAYMFKRHAGFDTVNYMGNGSSRTITHSMNQVPEMIVVKKVEASGGWQVYHKGAGNTKYMYWNQDYQAQTSSAVWGDTTPTSTVFTVGGGAEVNENSYLYQAMLFSSVTGVSKVDSYTGNGSSGHTITVGFQPRFLMVKATTQTQGWFIFDTTRGWASGVDEMYRLNVDTAQDDSTDYCNPTSTGFEINITGNALNGDGETYVYFAHA